MTRHRSAVLTAVTAMLLFLVWAPQAAAQNTYNCDDFEFQEDAQAVLDQDPSDPHNLDSDDDGIACESLPSRGDGGGGGGGDDDSGGAPSGGIDTGAGGTAPLRSDGTPWTLVAGVATAMAAAAGLAVRRLQGGAGV